MMDKKRKPPGGMYHHLKKGWQETPSVIKTAAHASPGFVDQIDHAVIPFN